MNVHWLAPTQTPRNPAFLQCNLEPHHNCSVHSWGLGSTSAAPWIALALPKAHRRALGQIRACATALSHREQPTAQNGSRACQEGHFGRSATQKADRKNILPGSTSMFQTLDINSAAPILLTECLPSPGVQNGKTSCHRKLCETIVFHHSYNKLQMCIGPVDIAAPKLSGFSSYLPASFTALTSSHLAQSAFLKFDHRGLPMHL